MSKWRERIDKILRTEHDRIETKVSEAKGNYADTGYDRYFNQIERYEKALSEVDTFLDVQSELTQALDRCRSYEDAITAFRKDMDNYKLYHRGMERPIDETVDALSRKLDRALGEVRR